MKLQQVLSKTRQAVDDYHMIQTGDNIAVGISGGKDSLSLLYALCKLQKFYSIPFSLCAVTVDLGFQNVDFKAIGRFCDDLEVAYHIIPTNIAEIVFQQRGESNPCSLCSKMRKGALNEGIRDLGCNKVAYGHHMDDAVETMLLSLIYEGRFHTFLPVTTLDKSGISVIRPFLYLQEAEIIGFNNIMQFPVLKSPCPADGNTKREYVKQMLRRLNLENPGVKQRMFHAIQTDLYERR